MHVLLKVCLSNGSAVPSVSCNRFILSLRGRAPQPSHAVELTGQDPHSAADHQRNDKACEQDQLKFVGMGFLQINREELSRFCEKPNRASSLDRFSSPHPVGYRHGDRCFMDIKPDKHAILHASQRSRWGTKLAA
ncbi:hypothetical protein [Novosphingobium sp. PY1]|uniref:hypothetical protein n=1 Tax=Novosphingobium sp. PY1 TaxID=1882221 RepID=UPI001A8D7FA8|nr:hypothetical protein [Novosphingobium sp. PY1]